MSETRPLLIEIGVEEMPAGVSGALHEALCSEVRKLLEAHDILLKQPSISGAYTPRRLLLHDNACPLKQPDRDETVWGPPERVAFDADGAPTKAAEGFARKTGLSLDDFTLEERGDGKGRYMKAVVHREGRAVVDILAGALPGILRRLPSPKQMVWEDGDARDDAFIRPIRWIVARLGDDVIPFSYAGVKSGTESRGHRIHGGAGELDVADPFGWLEEQRVVADRTARRERIREVIGRLTEEAGLRPVADADLLDEVTDLTEWPVPLLCAFDEAYLRLPEEVIRSTLKSHQRCFITADADGALSSRFVAVANLESTDPAQVATGNARVVNARLSDAAFYYDRDPRTTLEARVAQLNDVVFQEGLGSVGDQVSRLRGFVLDLARHVGADAETAQRAAHLCKSDLTTGLVDEFPELQGYMGGVYARLDGESETVATAIAEHYRPAGADDELPESAEARAIAVAERVDKLLGYFHLGRVPTATADPFGLRRAAIGLIRLLTAADRPVECDLEGVLAIGARQWRQQGATIAVSDTTVEAVAAFVVERLTRMSGELGVNRAALDAALAASSRRPLYRHVAIARLLSHFADSETGQAVAAANKRIVNILRKSGEEAGGAVDSARFVEKAERALFEALERVEASIDLDRPERAIDTLAGLREPVDRFFDDVMVMCDDAALRRNRLALLARLRALFLGLADVSRL